MSEGITVWIWGSEDGSAKPCEPPTVAPSRMSLREAILQPVSLWNRGPIGGQIECRVYDAHRFYFPYESLPFGGSDAEMAGWCAERACEMWTRGIVTQCASHRS